jgi:N-acetylmuramoyl-L-alanine amidase
MNVKWVGCAAGNFRTGRSDHKIEAIVIHLMDGSLESCDNWFNTPLAKREAAGWKMGPSSAHYGVGKDGAVHQYVHEEDEAYHAGHVQSPSWKHLKPGVNPNLYTVGIEHEGKVEDVWTEAQVASSVQLIAQVAKRWSIPLDRDHVVGHHEIYAPKPCPGPHANLDKLIAMALEVKM